MGDTHQTGTAVRRTVVIDDTLLREAQRALGTGSIRATIERSLAEAIRQRRLRAFADALGTFQMAMTREELLDQRRREAGVGSGGPEAREARGVQGRGRSGQRGRGSRGGRGE